MPSPQVNATSADVADHIIEIPGVGNVGFPGLEITSPSGSQSQTTAPAWPSR
jgi:hypothetical protein